jgi:cytochrome b involved in lipid metabolism
MKKILLFTFITVLTACSSSENNGAYTKSQTVENNLSRTIKSPWKKIDNEGSDLAFNNSKSNSIFIFNSACRKFDPSNLPTLTNSILTGIDNLEIFEKTTTTHQDREAVLVVAKGNVDGITRYFRVLTTQKNNCIYDYALISTSEAHLNKDTKDFNNFIQLLKLN